MCTCVHVCEHMHVCMCVCHMEVRRQPTGIISPSTMWIQIKLWSSALVTRMSTHWDISPTQNRHYKL